MECKPSVSKAHVYAFNLKATFDTYLIVSAHVCTCMFAAVVCGVCGVCVSAHTLRELCMSVAVQSQRIKNVGHLTIAEFIFFFLITFPCDFKRITM